MLLCQRLRRKQSDNGAAKAVLSRPSRTANSRVVKSGITKTEYE